MTSLDFRICKACQIERPIADFSKGRGQNRLWKCKPCVNQYYRERWEARPDVRDQKAAYAAANRVLYAQASAKWRLNHPQTHRASYLAAYARDPAKQRAKSSAYHATHRARCVSKMAERRAALVDSYVATVLGLPKQQLPPALIEAARAKIALHRLIKEMKP